MKVKTIITNLEKPCKIVLKKYYKDGNYWQHEKVHYRKGTFLLQWSDKVLDCRKISDKRYEITCRSKY